MSPKSVAFLIVGMLVISSVFFIFHVSYPSNPATIKLNNPPKNVKPQNLTIFQNQSLNLPQLGLNQTNFTPTGNTSLTLQGYVYNNSSPNRVIANQRLGIAVMQAFTMVTTNSQGFYQVQIKAAGQGTFAFKAFQYSTTLYDLYIGPGMTSLTKNIHLNPEPKYDISGFTQSHGNDIPGVALSFKSFWGTYGTYSTGTGSYSVHMVDGNYSITDLKTGFSPFPDPSIMGVDNTSINNFDILLNTTNQAILHMSGFVFNQMGNPVGGASIGVISPPLPNGGNITTPAGYYNISVAYYNNDVQITATGYALYTNTVVVTRNMTDQNFTISSLDPFQPQGNTGTQTTGPQGMGKNVSSVGYQSPISITITGRVILTQTGMPVPNQQFTVYTSVNGTYFFDQIQTDSGGNYYINLSYPGNFNFTILSTNFNETWLAKDVSGSVSGVPIYVSTSPSKIYNISGGLFNGIGNTSLANATINITSPTGQLLKTIHVNSTGNFSFSVLGGNYNLNISAPGFNSTVIPITVNKNLSNLNISLQPTTGISPGSSQWYPSSGSGLPGVNNTTISSQINSTQNSSGQAPATVSGTPVILHLKMVDNTTSTPIANTPFMVFIKVNGLYLRASNQTNSTGGALLPLSYGGTYIILPEMIDYTGSATFVNTSNASNPIVFLLDPLPQYSMQINLSNPLGVYNGSQVPISGLTGDGYYLPIYYNSSYSGSNYTIANYTLPNGTYSFTYVYPSYVPSNFSVSINGSSVYKAVKLEAYALELSWSAVTSWSYSLTGTGITNAITSQVPSSSSYRVIALDQGSFSFSAKLHKNVTNSTTFTLSPAHTLKNLSFNLAQSTDNFNNVVWSYNYSSVAKFTANATMLSSQAQYVSQVYINMNLSTDSYLYLGSNGSFWKGGSTLNLTNYFVTKQNTDTAISIVSYGFQNFQSIPSSVNIAVVYYTTGLTG